jgi:hypothetical protein
MSAFGPRCVTKTKHRANGQIGFPIQDNRIDKGHCAEYWTMVYGFILLLNEAPFVGCPLNSPISTLRLPDGVRLSGQ